MTANAGYATLQLIPSLRGAEAVIASELGGVGKSTEAEGVKAGNLFGAGFTKKLAFIGPAAAAGVAVGLAEIGSSFDEQFDKIRVGTGATGGALESLQGSFKNVLRTTATDFDTAGTAIADLNQKLGLTGQPLETLAKQFADVSRITGTDFKGNLDAGIKALQNFGVPADQQSAKLDALYRASQASGVSFGDLSSQMASSGVVLRQVGFDFDQSAILISALGKAGVDASDVMPGLSKAMATAAKEGKSAGDVFKDTFDKIKNAKTDTDAAAAAMEVFGAKAGPKLAALIREGKFSLDDMTNSVKNGSDTIEKSATDTEDWGEKWTKLKNNVLVLVEPLATKMFNAIGAGTTVLTEVATAFGEDGLSGAVDVLKGKFDNLSVPLKLVTAAIALVGATALISAAQSVAAWAAAEAKAVASTVVSVVQFGIQIAEWVALGIAAAANALIIAAAWLISLGPIALVVAAVVGLAVIFVKNFDTIKDAVETGFRFVVDKVLAAAEWIIKGAAAAFGWVPGIGGKLKAAAKEFEGFRDDVNRALGGVKKDLSITIHANYTSSNQLGPRTPGLARGGSFSGLALVGEEGPELIVGSGRVISNPDLMSMVSGASTGSSTPMGGPLIHIDEAHFDDEVDLDILFARAQFASTAGALG